MKTLISMTDFVLQDWSKYKGYCSEDYKVFAYNKNVILENYAKFLKQPLTLGMFVPCDENGNVLKELFADFDGSNQLWVTKYNEAKEKVLFKGWFKIIDKNTVCVYNMEFNLSCYKTLEDLVKNKNLFEFELTESAIKQIGHEQ